MARVTPSTEPTNVFASARTRSVEFASPGDRRPVARIHLLGPMRAVSYLGQDILPAGRKARAVLGCLCLAHGLRIPRSRLAAMLWDRVPGFQARASFRQSFRELMISFGPLAKELLSADRETIALNNQLCWIDAVAVLATDLPLDQHRAQLASHCAGELFEDLGGISARFDQWLLGERTRFSEQLRSLLESELSDVNGPNSDASARADIARRLIMFDPTHEGASRILMRALADMCERAQASREYMRLREALKVSLALEPSLETRALYEAISMSSTRDVDSEAAAETAYSHGQQATNGAATERSRLRVGVLPLLAKQAPQDEGLAFSLGQEIAAALARFRWFDVVAPVSLVQRPSTGLVSEEILRRRELDYVVDGALSADGQNYYINVRLLDLAHYATPVWSSRFVLPLDELHRLDEIVTARIAGQIDPVILFIEGQPKRREHPGSMGLLLRAIPLLYSMQKDKYEKAGDYIRRALKADPDNAMAAAWAAHWEIFYAGQGWSDDVEQTFKAARELAL